MIWLFLAQSNDFSVVINDLPVVHLGFRRVIPVFVESFNGIGKVVFMFNHSSIIAGLEGHGQCFFLVFLSQKRLHGRVPCLHRLGIGRYEIKKFEWSAEMSNAKIKSPHGG